MSFRMGIGCYENEGRGAFQIRWLISRNAGEDDCSGLLGGVLLEHVGQFSISVFGHEDDDAKTVIP